MSSSQVLAAIVSCAHTATDTTSTVGAAGELFIC